MRRTITLLVAAAALAAGITGSASAATLYTTSAHTTPVAVGTDFGMVTPPGATYYMYHGVNNPIDFCQPLYLFHVVQNSGGVFKSNITGRKLSCAVNGWGWVTTGALTISGSSTTVGSNKVWVGTSLTGALTLGGNTYTENFTGAGVSAQQPTTGGSPVSIVLNNAGTMTTPGMTGGPITVTGSFNFVTQATGALAPYSLG
jgi:hypothetical protein